MGLFLWRRVATRDKRGEENLLVPASFKIRRAEADMDMNASFGDHPLNQSDHGRATRHGVEGRQKRPVHLAAAKTDSATSPTIKPYAHHDFLWVWPYHHDARQRPATCKAFLIRIRLPTFTFMTLLIHDSF